MFPLLSGGSHLARFRKKTERRCCRRDSCGKGLLVAGHLERAKVRSGVRGSDSLAWLESTTCIESRPQCCSSALASPEPVRTLTAARRTLDPSNKAPEPTAISVMPRASLSISDLKPRPEFPNQARVMPAVAVAHL